MITLSHDEVMLYKMLQGFFGHEHVVPQMRFIAICNSAEIEAKEFKDLAERHRCLFTVVDWADKPKVIFEISDSDAQVVDIGHLRDKTHAREILDKAGLKYVAVSRRDVEELGVPGGGYSFTDYLRDKLELERD